MCEPEPPISEAPLPTPEDWAGLYELACDLSARNSLPYPEREDACASLDVELDRMRPTYLRMKANHEDLR